MRRRGRKMARRVRKTMKVTMRRVRCNHII